MPRMLSATTPAPSAGLHTPMFRATLAAAIVLAVAMGFGRFAFTGLYPLMVRDHMLSVSAGSLAASSNYAGYLLGALLASRVPPARASHLCRMALAGTVVAMAALAIPAPAWIVIAIRLVAGAASAFAMVSAAVWLFNVVGNHQGAPVLFSGVGIGILLSAELIAGGNVIHGSSAVLWLVLAVAAALLTLAAWPALTREYSPDTAAPAGLASAGTARGAPGPWTLIGAYGLAGFGYIVTATYLPLFIRDALGQIDPIHVWAAFGLGAAPSCFLWHAIHRKTGTRHALALNLIVQAIGVILPVIMPSTPGYLGSALLVGGTFMGTVTIIMPAAKNVAARVRFNLIAMLTAAYGIGQVIGPLTSGLLMGHSHSFTAPLSAAALSLVVATAICYL